VTHWPQVKPLLAAGQIVLVDARPVSTYEAGHIPGAISLPVTGNPEDFSAFRAQHPTSAHIVVYCSSTSCSLSKQLADKLIAEFGYQKVEYMTGGYQEWQQAELGGSAATAAALPPTPSFQASEPLVAPLATPAVATSPATPPAEQIPILTTPTTWAEVKPLVQSGQVVMVDARPKSQFSAGHIPGAISLPFSTGPEDYDTFVKEHSPNQHLIVYCSSTSCSLAKRLADKLAKEYGFKKVQFMTGGYQEWQKAELTQTKVGS
jgi:rhodanese-related sulfurtransferase